MLFATIIYALTINTFCIVRCQAIPLIDLRNTLEQTSAAACSSNEGCWEWLPLEKIPEDLATIPVAKIDIRREAMSIDSDKMEEWTGDSPILNRQVHQSPMTSKQTGNRLSKKDGVMSRNWSAGGMPFSILYMNPHNPRGNHASTQEQEVGRIHNPTPPVTSPSNRIALRNRNSMPPRRQYSIIPQLFISYGWNPFGK